MGNLIAAQPIRGIRDIRGLGLGTNISPCAAWGHAAYKGGVSRCQIGDRPVFLLRGWWLTQRRKDAKGEAGCVLSWCLCVLSEAGVRNPSVGASGGGQGKVGTGTGIEGRVTSPGGVDSEFPVSGSQKTGVQTTDSTNGTDKQGLGMGSPPTCEVNDQPGWET